VAIHNTRFGCIRTFRLRRFLSPGHTAFAPVQCSIIVIIVISVIIIFFFIIICAHHTNAWLSLVLPYVVGPGRRQGPIDPTIVVVDHG
jgi:hypothetical protein